MNKCFKCGAEFEGSFCPNCGTRYEAVKTCPQCGAELNGSVKFCNHCGYSFVVSKKKQVGNAIKNFGQKSKAWLIAHKTLAIIVAMVLFVGILLAIILPLTVGNIFRANRIAKINIGDDYARVEKVLGKPYKSSEYEYNYYGDNILKKLKELDKLNAQMDKIEDFDDLEKFADKEDKLKEEIKALEYKHISVSFSDGKVTKVEYDSHAKQNGETAVKWQENGNKKQKVELIPNEVPYGLTPQDTDLYAKVFYADGSYKLGQISLREVTGDSTNGWTVTWADSWGEYSSVIQAGDDRSNVVVENSDYEIVQLKYGNYSLKILNNISKHDSGYSWDEYGEKITSIYVSEKVTSVPVNAFESCSNVDFVTDGICVYLGTDSNPYQNLWQVLDKNITTVTIPSSTVTLMDGVFSGCENLRNVVIPENVTNIGERAFYRCIGLTDLTIPDSVIFLSEQAFSECSNLTSLIIGNNVEDIGRRAFAYCSSLTSITIPASVRWIDSSAFYECTSLTSAIFEITDGWQYQFGEWYDIAASDLSDPAIAAQYLQDTYAGVLWYRSR